jgi:hypothetical protein
MRHRCDSLIINYLTLMNLKTPEMTGRTKSKFQSKFQFRLYSMPATGRNFSRILNLDSKMLYAFMYTVDMSNNRYFSVKILMCSQSQWQGLNVLISHPLLLWISLIIFVYQQPSHNKVLNFLPEAAQKDVWTDSHGKSGAGSTLQHHSLDS